MSEFTAAEREAVAEAMRTRSEFEQTEAAFDLVRSEMFEAMAATKLGQADLREQLYLGVNMLDRVRAAMRAVISGGAVAEHSAMIRGILTGADTV